MDQQHSPLFIPALWEGDSFKVLDETLLPWKVEYITVRNVSEALQAVKEMKTRAFGQVLTFLYTAAVVTKENHSEDLASLRHRLAQLTAAFAQARPTFDFKGLGRLLDDWLAQIPDGAHPGRWLEEKIHKYVAAVPKAREARANRAAELLPNACRLLTHCNVSGEVAAVARCGEQMGKKIQVIATETRPYMQGSRLTAWEVAQAGIPVALIPDCAIAQVMAKGEADAVLVGADRSAQNGDIINKVGTYPLAVAAKKYGLPFYVLVQDPRGLARGEDAFIEERPIAELLNFQGRSLAPQGAGEIRGRYPAFDITPAHLISFLIGFEGTFTPENFRQKYQRSLPTRKENKEGRDRFLLVYGIPKKRDRSYLASALKAERCQSILVPEMRPELWGARVVAHELLEKGLPMALISDNMMGIFFAQRQIERLYVFYTELSDQGVVGMCGSLLAVLLARAHGVPVELLASEEPKQIPPDHDVTTFLGQRVCPEGVAIYPLEKEIIPWSLFKEEGAGVL